MIEKNKIIEYLKKDKINNINMINFMENYPIYYMKKIGHSVIAKGTSDRNWIYISSKSEGELIMIMRGLDNSDKNFAVMEDWMIPILKESNKIKWKLSTMRLILPNGTSIPELKQSVSKLTVGDAEFIYKNSDYKDFISIKYVIERIINGESTCIRYGDIPIAWGITQDDGAIGFLHVLPKYRNRGYGKEVMVDLIKKTRDKEKIPFGHIEEDNEKSMRLALSLGFEKDKVVSWVGVYY